MGSVLGSLGAKSWANTEFSSLSSPKAQKRCVKMPLLAGSRGGAAGGVDSATGDAGGVIRMNDERKLCFVPLGVQVKVLHPKKTGRAGKFSGA